MKVNRIIRAVLDNFYLRNLFVLLVLASMKMGGKAAMKDVPPWIIFIEVIFLLPTYATFLIHNLVLYKKLFLRKKYVLYFLSVILMVFMYRNLELLMLRKMAGFTPDFLKGYFILYWVDFVYVYVALAVYLAFTYSRERERLLQIENEKKELELKQLNQQLNPHFLFNALNNIYSYLLLAKGNGQELILKLSELMRYILDSSKKEYVTLHEEIRFIEHFIAFEKERLGERCTVEYCKKIDNSELTIVPLILFSFIENAFKHGTAAIGHSDIKISISTKAGQLNLQVINSIRRNGNATTQIGLINTQRRLDLLYPEKHELDIQHTPDTYAVSLKIKLDK
jgi:sensor histidine kinase YesM